MKLDIATSCNLACDYCFVDRGKRLPGPTRMSAETVRKAIRWFAQTTGENGVVGDVVLFGGEPLLNRAAVLAATSEVSRLRASGQPMTLQMVTNATLADTETAQALERAGATVMISIDGSKARHDKHRRDPQGRGSYAATLRGLGVIRRHLPEEWIWARGTFSSRSDQVSIFDDLMELGFQNINMGPITDVAGVPGIDESYEGEFDAVVERYVEVVREGRFVNLYPVTTRLRQLYAAVGRGLPADFLDCGAGTRMIAVAADGSFFPCDLAASHHHRVDWSIGNVDSGLDSARVDSFNAQTAMTHTQCSSCWAALLCDGGCKVKRHLGGRYGRCHAESNELAMVWRTVVRWYERLLSDDPRTLLRIVHPAAYAQIRSDLPNEGTLTP